MTASPVANLTIADAMAMRERLRKVSDTPDLDVALLLCECLAKPRSYLYSWPERELDLAQIQRYLSLLARRIDGEPIAHILARRDFWSLPLAVSPATLIPRPDTECLVERALEMLAEQDSPAILDLGTGTGAIALAIGSERADAQVVASDFFPEVVALAEQNRIALAVSNVRVICSNWFSSMKGLRFKLIVSNPPYIDPQDPHLDEGDVRFEPRSALVAGNKGMADLFSIIGEAPNFLLPGGELLLEHGFDQGALVRQALRDRGFVSVASRNDYGGNERISWGTWT
ncbi:Release factor glutamine methyltransferase [Zhongshania aliphaticivorans]|uniref:Release factor glutamine methyltransferase n=1 Tax=Zhongshania aliphaticivorans TaxID=1470434 RepID=A0A5S9N1N6_9GAMM|nr:peptide chain release factor N(5)-glutamine methyltransferase [Zhongshania aliphaticivorans]CAA0083192.1 Release factor glutamine methyltransferase [Zhongshania aliphaticivorans]CAA0083589.1 Release factor glutamine methyltransferase [Zhongshania aliphaticivorans]